MELETEVETTDVELPKFSGNPKKLADDSWGAWVNGQPVVGDTVRIHTKSGKEWDAEITEIIEQGADHVIARTKGIN